MMRSARSLLSDLFIGSAACAPSPDPDTGMAAAFVWSESTRMVEAASRLPVETGWTLIGASGIDDSGRIVGWGQLNGQRRARVMTSLDGAA